MTITMESPAQGSGFQTHEVYNQPGDLADYDPYGGDRVLTAAVATFGAEWAGERLEKAGRLRCRCWRGRRTG